MAEIGSKCWTCKHLGADPNDVYCGHPEAFKHSGFGVNIDRMRGIGRYAKLDRKQDPAIGACENEKLFEPR